MGRASPSTRLVKADLFSLAPVPAEPHPSFLRLGRHDLTGLVWLLQGRRVTALTADTASIWHPTGSITVFRKNNRPAYGLVGIPECEPIHTRPSAHEQESIARMNTGPCCVSSKTREGGRNEALRHTAVCAVILPLGCFQRSKADFNMR
jgi:hypothetical protein